MTHARKLGVLMVILALGFGLAGAMFTQNTLHVPRRVGRDWGTAARIRARDGAELRASWIPARRVRDCVLILHGISDSRASFEGFARVFVQRGYSALVPDSRAHGESGGDVVTYGLLEKYDAIGWANWLKQNGCRKVYGLGESLGASVLIQAAAVEPVFSAIVTESAFADLQEAAEHRLMRMIPLPDAAAGPLAWLAAVDGKWYARVVYGLDLGSVSPLAAMPGLQTPVLFIHGLSDDQTPAEDSRRLAVASRAAQLWLVPRLGHASAYSADPEEYRRRVFGWFEAH